jgi:WD40 repeat protein
VDTVYGVNFSRDSVYLAVAIWSSPNILIFKRNGDTFTKLSDPATLPTGPSNKIKFSDDGTYLAVTHGNPPGITIYKRSGDTFTKLPNPASLPPSTAHNVDFSPDGTYLAVAHANTPFITIYKRDGDTFTKINNPSILPTSTARGCSFAMNPSNILDNSLYFATTHYGSPFVTIYKKENNTDNFIKLANPAILPNNVENSDQFCKFDSTATFLGVGQDRTPGFRIYKRSGDTFTKITDPASFQNTYGMTLDFSDNNGYLAIAKAESSTGLTLYKTTLTPAANSFTKISKANNTLNLVLSTIEMTESAGYALEDGTAGQTKTMMSLFRKEE